MLLLSRSRKKSRPRWWQPRWQHRLSPKSSRRARRKSKARKAPRERNRRRRSNLLGLEFLAGFVKFERSEAYAAYCRPWESWPGISLDAASHLIFRRG